MHNRLQRKRDVFSAMVGIIMFLVWGMTFQPVFAQTETQPSYSPLSGIIAISAESAGYTCALTESGGVECWGDQSTGAENILNISEAVAIASGGQHSCVITRFGGVQCWGYNSDGQLGDGSIEISISRGVDVKGLRGEVTSLGLGFSFSCAVLEGEVWCWGENNYGQLGDGTTINRSTPKRVEGLSGEIIAITAGNTYACALNASGGVQCWGGHIGSVLGNSDIDTPSAPISVTGLASGVTQIAARDDHTCALASSGKVMCWGMNESGQLGHGETSWASDAPVLVIGLPENVSAISTGINHTCAMTNAGEVLCWGDNRAGELGDGSNIDRLTPATVIGLSGKATAIAAGEDYTCAVVDGGVQCWGENNTDQLGTGIDPDSNIPVIVTGLTGASAIAAGGDTSCALMTNGQVLCWGENESGQVGDGTNADQSQPRVVQGLQGQGIALSVGMGHACALIDNGVIQCWGSNLQGALGNEALGWDGSKTAVSVANLPGGATVISAGNNHTCAIIDSSVYCWGNNSHGQLGDGTTEDHSIPTAINDLRGKAITVSAGFDYTCAITSAGAVFCWGNNQYGQLGDGTTEARSSPKAVAGLESGIVSVAAGEDHTCALTTAGAVKCWGKNLYGQLGNGTTEASLVPVNVDGLSGKAVAIAANRDLTCALLDTGGVQCWGDGASVGSGDTFGRITTSTNVSGLTGGVRGITVGRFHACAVLNNGTVQCWGTNWNGQLGNGTGPDSSIPLTVVLGPRQAEEKTGGFRTAGPLVPEITTYIPTPLDLSPKPSVIGTNLLLAALMMLPFAIAAEFFTRTLAENEETLKRRFHPVHWIARLQERLTGFFGQRIGKTRIGDILKILGVMLFYGLVFSLLDKTWKPFSWKGLILFLSMTIAYGLVGVADDIIQWRRIRRWGLSAELKIRPTNMLLATLSMATTRILSLIPGLMFGTPEALEADESQFDEPKRNTLLRISGFTFIVIGLVVWLPTIATGLVLNLALPELVANLLGGVEAFLLVIFAVALENLFIQMLGFPGSFGHSLKRKSRWLWIGLLILVTFVFYHTLINPRGELAAALEEGNVLLFLAVAAAFVVITFGMRLFFRIRNRRTGARTITAPLATPEPASPSSAAPVRLEVGPAPVPVPVPAPAAPMVFSLGGDRQCPACGNTIKAEAKLCRFCRSNFTVTVRGYCLTDHDIVEVTKAGKCVLCGADPADLYVESRLLQASSVMPANAAAPIQVAATTPVSDTRHCPNCGQSIKAEARMCRFCKTIF